MKDQKNRMVNERDFRQDPNYVAPDPEKKKLILKLGTMITDRYLVKYSRTMNTDDPEYWALDEVLTKEEAKFLLSFKKTRVPYDIGYGRAGKKRMVVHSFATNKSGRGAESFIEKMGCNRAGGHR